MSESTEVRDAVLQSLREQPMLNTPTLIAGGKHIPAGTEQAAIESVLGELVAEGLVKHRPTGWKLAPGAA